MGIHHDDWSVRLGEDRSDQTLKNFMAMLFPAKYNQGANGIFLFVLPMFNIIGW